ncbi:MULTISPECIES: type IV pilin protein [Caldimonas]|uniref:type IV pilin protein n=1 Tax=Caldimonas TaxID=196013 RepID=UPI0021DF2206|nr:type IV pilin protein [Caldimonas taiwanensis]GIX23444.1 MAG: type IV minor pilin protein PilE [Caldimonas sp.]
MSALTTNPLRVPVNTMRLRCILSSASRGFTLVEILIVVAIVGILAAIAYPSYQQHVVSSRRAAAQACLVEMAQFMERFYTTHMRYDRTATSPPTNVSLPQTQCVNDLANFYTFAFAENQPTAVTYTVEARPQGAQATADAGCGTLSLTHTGVKGRSGSADLARCWR